MIKKERSLYGLNDAARIWHELVKYSCQKTWLKESPGVPCILIENRIIVVCYVDDFLIFAKHRRDINRVKQNLEKHFVFCDLGEATNILGMEIDWTKKGQSLSNKKSSFKIIK